MPGAHRVALPAVPGRRDLGFLDDIAAHLLIDDPSPSLTDIASSPSVSYMGEPTFAPQQPSEPLRVIVSGSDAALGAVLTRMMRADYLWAEVAYLPADPSSPAAVLWDIPGSADAAMSLAVSGSVRPIPCVRHDAGVVVAGSATLTDASGGAYIGEIVVDNEVLLFNQSPTTEIPGPYGARLVPTVSAPGIAAAALVTPASLPPRTGWQRLRPRRAVSELMTDPDSVLTGRAVQSGGSSIQVTVNSVAAPRPVNRVTFYRHLRDIQAVRG